MEYHITEILSLRLEGKQTVILLRGSKFMVCKRLPLEISKNREIDSVDEAQGIYKSTSRNESVPKILPEQEFWGHVSNLQNWVEHNYDTHLLHKEIAFPLLKKLAELGDLKARRVFKDEMVKRFQSGRDEVITYLISEGFLDFFPKDEQAALLKKCECLHHEEIPFYTDLVAELGLPVKVSFIKDSEKKMYSQLQYPPHLFSKTSLVVEDKRIIIINLSKCQIRSLPESIRRLKHVKKINLAQNQLSEIPSVLKELPSLEWLDLTANSIQSIDQNPFPESLKYLYLGRNPIKSLSGAMHDLINLEILDLTLTELGALPSEIHNLHHLQVLICDFTNLKTLPASIGFLPNLSELHIDGTQIKSLPNSLYKSDALKVICVEDPSYVQSSQFSNQDLQLISPPYEIECMFEYDGNHFWASSKATEAKYGRIISPLLLPFPSEILDAFDRLHQEYYRIHEYHKMDSIKGDRVFKLEEKLDRLLKTVNRQFGPYFQFKYRIETLLY